MPVSRSMSILSKSSHSSINSRSSPNVTERIFRPITKRTGALIKPVDRADYEHDGDSSEEEDNEGELNELYVKISELSYLASRRFHNDNDNNSDNTDSDRSTPDLWLLPTHNAAAYAAAVDKKSSTGGDDSFDDDPFKFDPDGIATIIFVLFCFCFVTTTAFLVDFLNDNHALLKIKQNLVFLLFYFSKILFFIFRD